MQLPRALVLRRSWVAAGLGLVALAGVGVAADAPEMRPEARAHYDAGMARYAAKDFAAAIEEFREAYALEPRREILFAQAQATRLGGDCPAAVVLYQRFLTTDPPARQVEATRIALARCAEAAARPAVAVPDGGADASPAIAAAAPAGPPVDAGRPVVMVPASAVSPKPVVTLAVDAGAGAPAPWFRDTAGGVLVAGSVAALGVGTALLLSAVSADEDAQDVRNLQRYADRRPQAERRERWGEVSLAVGGALILGAISRYLWVGLRPEGRGVDLGGRF